MRYSICKLKKFFQVSLIICFLLLLINSNAISAFAKSGLDIQNKYRNENQSDSYVTQDALYPNKHSYNSSVYDGGLYYLKNEKSDKYLDLDHGRTDSGTNILGWKYNGNDNQKFYFHYLGMGLYEIAPYSTSETILHSASADEGANIEIRTKDRTVKQKFKLHMIAYDKAIIYTQASNFTKALYYNSSDKNIIQKDYDSLSSENKEYAHWTFNEIDSLYYSSYKKFYIKNVSTGLYLDAVNKGINNNTYVQLRPFTGEENQQWKRVYDNSSDCYY